MRLAEDNIFKYIFTIYLKIYVFSIQDPYIMQK